LKIFSYRQGERRINQSAANPMRDLFPFHVGEAAIGMSEKQNGAPPADLLK